MTSIADWSDEYDVSCPQDDDSGRYAYACERVTRHLKIVNVGFSNINIVQIILLGAKYTDQPDKCYLFQDGSAEFQQ